MLNSVEEPVQFCRPSAPIGVTEHVLEVGQGLLVCLLHCQSFPQISNIVDALKLGDSCKQKQVENGKCNRIDDLPVGNIMVNRVIRRLACFLKAM